MKRSRLEIRNLMVEVENKEILKGISLTLKSGELHVIMGPNGSGKSTLANALMGNPMYRIKNHRIKDQIKILIDSKDISDMTPDERAKQGLFLAFQNPIAIPGVSVFQLLRQAYQEQYADKTKSNSTQLANPALSRQWKAKNISVIEFMNMVKQFANDLSIRDELLERGIHDGFSGGEKKKIEMLQALVLKPKFVIFDEIDTGLDVDALKTIATGIELLHRQETGILVITHYQRLLSYLHPDIVHILISGKIMKSGGSELINKIEKEGYASIKSKDQSSNFKSRLKS